MQDVFNFLKPESNWKAPSLHDLPSSWAGIKRVGLDTETRDPTLKELGPGGGRRPNSYVTGFSVAFEMDNGEHKGFYLPIRHQGGDNMNADEVIRYMQAQAEVFDGQMVGMNLGYDLDIMAADDIHFKKVSYFRDVQLADVLINELENAYSLDAISKRLGFAGKDTSLLKAAAAAYGVDYKSGMWKLPARYVGPYGETDAILPMQVLRKQEFKIEENDLWDIFNLESELLPVLIKIRRRGIRIDLDKLEEIERWSLQEEALELRKVKDITGYDIGVGNVWKKKALIPALEYLGVEFKRTAKGEPVVDKDLFAFLNNPVADAIQRARKVNKLRTTFADSIRRYMVNGRIHCTLNQMAREDDDNEEDVKGARYGRLSSEDPNMQQQPSKDEFAAFWRSIYLPEEGELWCTNDYSQQEPRWTVHFAETLGLPRAKEAAERYRTDPTTDNHQMMADLAKIDRKPAKEIFLGLCYGMGGAKLCRKLGLPTRWAVWVRGETWDDNKTFYAEKKEEVYEILDKYPGSRYGEVAGEEGQNLLNTFDSEVPFVRNLAKRCQAAAKKRGWIRTIGGRVLHFPRQADGAYDWVHKALNRLIQGSSADQTKRAMVEVDKAGHTIILQVHDEVDTSVRDKEEAFEIARIMRECIQATVPFKVDTEIGPSWGEAK